MQWSHYSEAIFDTFLTNNSNIIVQACPGAGKTTNVKHLWTLTDKSTVYLVFNKHSQLEAETKLPVKQDCNVLTLNSLGYRTITANVGRVILDDRKVYNIIKDHIVRRWGNVAYKQKAEQSYQLARAVQCAKQFAVPETYSVEAYDAMISQYDLEEYGNMYEDIADVLAISDDMLTVIDFADQIRLPVVYSMKVPHYDTVLGDEVQDFNSMQAQFIQRINADKYVLVGDKHQSIYGFRGAMNNSMQVLKNMYNCVELPLSITYRCAKNIVKEAYAIYPDIEAWDESGDGLVHRADSGILQYDKNVIVLCRLNKPLIQLAFKLLADNVACHVRGRDIGDGLVRIIKQQAATGVRQLTSRLQEWYAIEMSKALFKEDEHRIQAIDDKYTSLLIFVRKCKLDDNVQVVIDKVNDMFEQGKGVCLSTVHKAKGLEADKCYLLGADLFDLFAGRSKQQWQREQERNIKYVAVTRGRNALVYM